eukprot:355040-Chlamydomonas_euryale.AAC.14
MVRGIRRPAAYIEMPWGLMCRSVFTAAECSVRSESLNFVSQSLAQKRPGLSPGWHPEAFSSANANL